MGCESNDPDSDTESDSPRTTSVGVHITLEEMVASKAEPVISRGGQNYKAVGNAADVVRVTIEVKQGAVILAAEQDLVNDGSGNWSGTVDNLPIGPTLSFIARSYDVLNTEIFSGTTISTVSDVNNSLAVNLEPIDDQLGMLFPGVDQIMRPVEIVNNSNANIEFSLSGSTDELLSYEIIADPIGGSFVPATGNLQLVGSSATLIAAYTAPDAIGSYNHTIKVTNSQGNSVTSAFNTEVVYALTSGGIQTNLNPVIDSIDAQRVGNDVIWTATVSDDGPLAELTYAWSFSGISAFAVNNTNPATLGGYDETDSGDLTLTVTDQNGTGGATTVVMTVGVGMFPNSVVVNTPTKSWLNYDRSLNSTPAPYSVADAYATSNMQDYTNSQFSSAVELAPNTFAVVNNFDLVDSGDPGETRQLSIVTIDPDTGIAIFGPTYSLPKQIDITVDEHYRFDSVHYWRPAHLVKLEEGKIAYASGAYHRIDINTQEKGHAMTVFNYVGDTITGLDHFVFQPSHQYLDSESMLDYSYADNGVSLISLPNNQFMLGNAGWRSNEQFFEYSLFSWDGSQMVADGSDATAAWSGITTPGISDGGATYGGRWVNLGGGYGIFVTEVRHGVVAQGFQVSGGVVITGDPLMAWEDTVDHTTHKNMSIAHTIPVTDTTALLSILNEQNWDAPAGAPGNSELSMVLELDRSSLVVTAGTPVQTMNLYTEIGWTPSYIQSEFDPSVVVLMRETLDDNDVWGAVDTVLQVNGLNVNVVSQNHYHDTWNYSPAMKLTNGDYFVTASIDGDINGTIWNGLGSWIIRPNE